MNPYNFIIDNQGASHSIFSQQGRNLLKQYLRNYKNGGMDEADKAEAGEAKADKAEAGGMYKCKTMEEEDGTYTACRRTDNVNEATHNLYTNDKECQVVESMDALETKEDEDEDFNGAEVYFEGDGEDEFEGDGEDEFVEAGAESKSSTPGKLRAKTSSGRQGFR